MQNFFEFIKNEPKFSKLSCGELLFVEYNCPLQNQVQDVWSQCNYLAYVLSGKKAWKTYEREWVLQSGESIFVKKGGHFVEQYFGEEFCVLLYFFPDHYITSVIENCPEKLPVTDQPSHPFPVFEINLDETLTAFYQSTLSYFTQINPPPKPLLDLKFRELMYHLLFGKNNRHVAAYFRSVTDPHQTTLRNVMEANFMYNLQLEEYAKLCGQSLTSFKRNFRQIFNTSPGRWLLQKRIHFARMLLLNTEKTIQEIAFESGFENHSHFTRVFKENFNNTPQQLRLHSR